MTPLTEAELLRMRGVQAGIPAPWYSDADVVFGPDHHGICRATHKDTGQRNQTVAYLVTASTDWPRVTEWALEARRLLVRLVEMGHRAYCLAIKSPTTCDCGYDEARCLLGEL